ncbi:hypothetical protein CISIN_1g0258352mg, partial [Citrus sinensis]
IEKAS